MDAIFVTNQYRVLEFIHDSTILIADDKYCPLGQGEIAKNLGLSRAVVNKIFSELRDRGYIIMVTRGKWKLSEHANEIIKVTHNL